MATDPDFLGHCITSHWVAGLRYGCPIPTKRQVIVGIKDGGLLQSQTRTWVRLAKLWMVMTDPVTQ